MSAGGLLVLGTSLQEGERIELQLRGRAGRQGDPGTTQLLFDLSDPLISAHGMQCEAAGCGAAAAWAATASTLQPGLACFLAFCMHMQGCCWGGQPHPPPLRHAELLRLRHSLTPAPAAAAPAAAAAAAFPPARPPAFCPPAFQQLAGAWLSSGNLLPYQESVVVNMLHKEVQKSLENQWQMARLETKK